MGDALIDLSRLMALRRKLEVAANNVANVETTGFRAQQLSFQEYLKPEKGQEIGIRPERPLSLVHAASVYTTAAAGPLRATGNPLDLAIVGNAYFVVQTPQGERFTRDGSFVLDGTGRLVTADGFPVMTDGGIIKLPSNAGTISIDGRGGVSTQQGELGRLRLVQFDERATLEAAGGNLLRSNTPPTSASGEVQVMQGFLERSNVQSTIEMSRLAEITRSYELASKLLISSQNYDDMNKLANVPD